MSHTPIKKIPRIKWRTYAISVFCALAIVSIVWYSHSAAPAAGGIKNPTLQSGRIAPVPKAFADSSKAVSVESWIGKKFIILNKPKPLKKYGYELYLTRDLSANTARIDTTIETDKHRLRCDKVCGSIIMTTSVQPVSGEYLVCFTEEKTGRIIYAMTRKHAVEGIAFVGDLASAAKQWIGKTVYSRRRFIYTYDSLQGTFGSIKVNVQDRLKVTSVKWGTTPAPSKSLWLFVTTGNNETGIIPVSQSLINATDDRAGCATPWEEDIFDRSPMELFAWDSLTWKAINSHTIVSGMNKEQVRISWGPPHRVLSDTVEHRCAEQWLYGSQILCFDHDTVSSVGAR